MVPAFSPDVHKPSVLVAVDIEFSELKGSEPCIEQHAEDGVVTLGNLVGAGLDLDKLLGSGF